ncbi:addiction module antitoxin, RelB/DinJ family [mine drainage metagenome]|uniref:Addiction module antitoxin, RelB/DinJ family n=1 Tax=mine drainage metagenome TaxID=410659 RepID=T0Y3Y9_9ZZZZ
MRPADAAHRGRTTPAFDVKVPNATTRKAIAELEAGKGKQFVSVDDLMADLHEDN